MSITIVEHPPIEVPINIKPTAARTKSTHKPNVTVHCQMEVFDGRIIGETTTHYLVTHEGNPDIGEWFAKQSVMTQCHPFTLSLT